MFVATTMPLALRAADKPLGDIILLNDNGAWSWFEGERVIVDLVHHRLLFSSVANSQGPGGAHRAGDVDVVSYDLASRTADRFTLSGALQEDDHDSAALLVLPDGRYLASYSKHATDNRLRYRVSVSPGNIKAWQPESVFLTGGGVTYSNLYFLSKTGCVFNFHRDSGRGFDPNYLLWNYAITPQFSYGGRVLTGPEGNNGNRDRPYLRYVGDGVHRIHFLVTDHHPRDLISNSIYHGYIEAENKGYGLYRSDGSRVGDLSTASMSPFKASDFTKLFDGNAVSPMNALRMTRGWTTDIELDAEGRPYVVFTARVDDNDRDHRFLYGRFTSDGWQIHELAKAGGFLYPRENDYTGLAALDPADPNHLYISTPVDPRTHAELVHYEIFEGFTADNGQSWAWKPVTSDSSVDNLRPIVPRGMRQGTVVVWMRGQYNTYTDYNTGIVGLIRSTSPEPDF